MRFLIFLTLSFVFLHANIGSVSMLNGKVLLTRDAQVSNLKIGDAVKEGDKINTFSKSRLQIIFNDDTVISIGKNSEYIVESYSDTSDANLEMRLNRGFLRTVSGKIGKMAPERFKLKTKNATIGIRGTGWLTYVEGDVEKYLCFSGEIVANTPDGVFNVRAGEMLIGQNGRYKKSKADMKIFNRRSNVKADLRSKSFSTPQLKSTQSAIGYIDSDIKEYKPQEYQNEPVMQRPGVSNTNVTNVLKEGSSLIVTAKGQGVAPDSIKSKARAMAMAKRAAIVDAYRVLAERINGVYVEGQDTIKNMAIKRTHLRSQVLAIVQNASIVDTKFKDGLYEVEMEIQIHYDSFK